VGDGKRLPVVDSYRKIIKSNFLLAQDSKLQAYYTRKLQQNVNIIILCTSSANTNTACSSTLEKVSLKLMVILHPPVLA